MQLSTIIFAFFLSVTGLIVYGNTVITPESIDTLVIAPHPDDAELGAGRMIMNEVTSGKNVAILVLTNGDAKEFGNYKISRDYGATRKAEQRLVADTIGVPSQQVIILNYPDGYLPRLENTLLTKSEYTGQMRSDLDSYSPGSLYTRSRLLYLMDRTITELNPKKIYVTSNKDKHADHSAAYELLEAVYKNNESISARVYTYQIHGRKFTGAINSDDEKREILELYKSQFHTPEYHDFMLKYANFPEDFTEVFFRKGDEFEN